jgi:hypothetical protein
MIARFVVFTLLAVSTALSQGTSTGGSALQLPFLADGAALAEASVAGRVGLGSVNTNPALLWGIASPELRIAHSQWMANVRTQVLAAALPSSDAVFGFALTNMANPDIEIREIPGAPLGTFTARSFTARLSAALPIAEGIVVGTTAKYVYEKILVNSTTGLALDAGISYRWEDLPLDLGIAITNIGSLDAMRVDKIDLPTTLRIGAARSFDFFGQRMQAFGAYSNELRVHASHLHAGLELIYDGSISARVGYVSGYESRDLSAGFGVMYGMIRLDYAYIPFRIGQQDSHGITVGLVF